MATTLTQARKLLTAAELQLFEASRADALKTLTAKQLAAKVGRARAQRDKFRDLYRRQTVATSRKPAAKRSATGGDNARTEQKATIFAEVLSRLEAQLAKVQARAEREAAAKEKAKMKAAAQKAKAKAAAEAGKRKKDEAKAAPKKAAKKAAAKAATKAAAKKESKKDGKKTAKKAAKKAVGKGSKKAKAKAAAAVEALTIGELQRAVKAAAAKPAEAPGMPASRTARIGRSKAAAPTDVTPVAERLNPLKAQAVNQKVHAAARASHARVQAKRDGS